MFWIPQKLGPEIIYADPVLDLAMRPRGSPYKNDVGALRKILKKKKVKVTRIFFCGCGPK